MVMAIRGTGSGTLYAVSHRRQDAGADWSGCFIATLLHV